MVQAMTLNEMDLFSDECGTKIKMALGKRLSTPIRLFSDVLDLLGKL